MKCSVKLIKFFFKCTFLKSILKAAKKGKQMMFNELAHRPNQSSIRNVCLFVCLSPQLEFFSLSFGGGPMPPVPVIIKFMS